MKVKIGNVVFDSNDQPIMVILEKGDKVNIAKMAPLASRYCSYPDAMDEKTVLNWMLDDNE